MSLKDSWSSISKDFAKEYLRYYPKQCKMFMSDFISKLDKEKKVKLLELGCGNCQNYEIYNNANNIEYTGVDFSETLLDVAREQYGQNDNITLVYEDIFKFLANSNEYYDICLLYHVIELTSSQDLLLDMASKISKYVGILWYEPPIHDHQIVELKDETYPNTPNTPYIRIKTSRDYYEHLIEKHNLMLVAKYIVDNNHQRLDILTQKPSV